MAWGWPESSLMYQRVRHVQCLHLPPQSVFHQDECSFCAKQCVARGEMSQVWPGLREKGDQWALLRLSQLKPVLPLWAGLELWTRGAHSSLSGSLLWASVSSECAVKTTLTQRPCGEWWTNCTPDPLRWCLMYACMLSRVWLFATPWTAGRQAHLSMEFSRQEYCSGLPFLPPWDLPDPGIEPTSPASPVLAGGFFTTKPPGMLIWCLGGNFLPLFSRSPWGEELPLPPFLEDWVEPFVFLHPTCWPEPRDELSCIWLGRLVRAWQAWGHTCQ